MDDRFKYIKIDDNNNLEAMAMSSRINESVNPELKSTLSLIDHASRICAVRSEQELIKFTDEYYQLLNAGDLGIIINTFTGITRIFVWVDIPTKWQEVSLGTEVDLSNYYTKEETDGALKYIIDGAPDSLNTLNELAQALGNDNNFATTVLNKIGETYTKVETDNAINQAISSMPVQDPLPDKTGNANKVLSVKPDETGYEWTEAATGAGLYFKGTLAKFSQIGALGTPQDGWFVSITTDETDQNNKNMYVYKNSTWVKLTDKQFIASSMPPNNTNILWIDLSAASPLLKWHNGTTWVPLSSGGGGTVKQFQVFAPNTNYQHGDIVLYNNSLFYAKASFLSGTAFDPNDWTLTAGDMSRAVYDQDYDGIVDMAEHALIADVALETDLIQTWKQNTSYTIGQQLVYLSNIYTVISDFTSGTTFDTIHLDLTATGHHNQILDKQGGDGTNFYHLGSVPYNVVNNFTESFNMPTYKGTVLGDMRKSVYDSNLNGIVDKAETLVGLTASMTELNYMVGSRSSIQSQIDSISHGMVFKGFVNTYADLMAITGSVQGDTMIVNADENNGGAKTFYTRGASSWTYLGPFTVTTRDFSVSPLDVGLESTGIYTENRIDPLIARKSDMHTHANLSLLDSYTQTDVDLADAVLKKHSHANMPLLSQYNQTNADIANAVSKTHDHLNKSTVDGFSTDSLGNLLWNGAPIQAGGTGSGGGISDLSAFNTADLAETTNKRYVTDAEKTNIGLIPSITSNQTVTNNKVNDILGKIPTDASSTNLLVSTSTFNSKITALKFTDLADVNHTAINNAFVVTDGTGKVTYRSNISNLINIQRITDKKGSIFSGVPYLKFSNLIGSLGSDGTVTLSNDNMYTTNLLDMPTTFVDGNVLVANASLMKYELKDIESLTNSKENFAINIAQTDWYYDASNNIYTKLIVHSLGSQNLVISSFSSVGDSINNMTYHIMDNNQVTVKCTTNPSCRVIINCSQGVSGNGTGSSGGTYTVTALDFIDDTRVRNDKTYSSQNIMDILTNQYALKTNVYLKAECDARYAPMENSHGHANILTLDKISEDLSGNMYFAGKKIITELQPRTISGSWVGEDYLDLTEIMNVNDVFITNNLSAILGTDFTIKNNMPSINEVEDAKFENQLHIVAVDGTLVILDVYVPPQSTQKYLLGISPNIKINVQGKFDANFYMTAY